MSTPDDPDFWQDRYLTSDTGWDLGGPAPAIDELLEREDLSSPARVLVPGCGRGHDALRWAEAGHEVLGVDLAPRAVEEARALAEARGLSERCRFETGDLFALGERYAGRFDVVWEYTCFCAILPERRGDYRDAIAAALRPGGLLTGLFYPDRDGEEGPPFPVRWEHIEATFLAPGRGFRLLERRRPLRSAPAREGFEHLVVMRRLGDPARDLLDVVDAVTARPSVHVMHGTFPEVCAFVDGYAEGDPRCPLRASGGAFNEYVALRLGTPANLHWAGAIHSTGAEDKQAMMRLRDLIHDFVADALHGGEDDLAARYAAERRARHERVLAEETGPEAVYRRFMIASLYGRQAEIRELITASPDAAELWGKAYPQDVADLLAEQARASSITRVASRHADADRIELISSLVPFAMTVVRTEGGWRVDPGPLIEARRSRGAEEG